MRKQPYNIAVCDDEQPDREQIAEMTRKVCDLQQIYAQIFCYESAGGLLKALKEGQKFDLLLIDVIMPELDGIELARHLRREKLQASIVFISYNREMALLGYEVSAARFLAKPLEEERLREAIDFCYKQRSREKGLLLPVTGGMRKVFPREIYYIEIKGRKSRIVQKKEEWDTGISIVNLEEMLRGQGFIRCHQSFLVNFRYVRTFRISQMELIDGRCIPVSKHRVKDVRQSFFEYMKY